VRGSYRAVARRRWPGAVWVDGEGRYASVALCGVPSVQLFETREAAERAKRTIAWIGCGSGCHRQHGIVKLGPPEEAAA
jgi:hypothetical protein